MPINFCGKINKKNKTLTPAEATGRAYVSKTSDVIIKIAAIVGAATILASAYAYYLNNIWKPDVEVVSVDFEKGVALVKIRDKEIYVYGDATFLINTIGDWGIRFGSSRGNNYYDRLELTKRGMVVEYLKR